MRIVERYVELNVPTWALSMLVNGDASGLEDAEIAQVQKWFNQFTEVAAKWPRSSVNFCSPSGDVEPYFTRWPEFGLACNCVECQVLILIPDEIKFVGLVSDGGVKRHFTIKADSAFLRVGGGLNHNDKFRPATPQDRDALIEWLGGLRFDTEPCGV